MRCISVLAAVLSIAAGEVVHQIYPVSHAISIDLYRGGCAAWVSNGWPIFSQVYVQMRKEPSLFMARTSETTTTHAVLLEYLHSSCRNI